jgi:hypothetical protein
MLDYQPILRVGVAGQSVYAPGVHEPPDSTATKRKGGTLVPEQDPGEEGRKNRELRSRAAQRARETVRYAVMIARFGKNLIDVIGFIDRHL